MLADHGRGPRRVVSDWIPIARGKRYRLSGRVWRGSPADNVYLDFDDGAGQGGSFEDAQALATSTEGWERVAAEATMGPTTTAVRVRCVRDGQTAATPIATRSRSSDSTEPIAEAV